MLRRQTGEYSFLNKTKKNTFFLSVVRIVALSCSCKKKKNHTLKKKVTNLHFKITKWKNKYVYLLNNLWSHSHLFANIHRLSTGALLDRHTFLRDEIDEMRHIYKRQSLTTAAGCDAGTAWGAINPAWGLSVARAVKINQTIKQQYTQTSSSCV